MRTIVYYASWSIYDRNFQVKDLDIDSLTDVNYAFVQLKQNEQGFHVPSLTDPWADIEKKWTSPGEGVDPIDTQGRPFYGNFNQFLKLKQHKNFKFGLSIGGWTGSTFFSKAVESEQSRKAFAVGLVDMCLKYKGLVDRIDLDWEYISPSGTNFGAPGNIVGLNDAENFSLFLETLTRQLHLNNLNIELSACVPGDPYKLQYWPLEQMSKYLTTINVMTYDFASSSFGPCLAGHHSNLFSTEYSPLSVDGVVTYILKRVPAHQIVIGIPFYSRGFANTDGLAKPSNGTPTEKSWEDGVCDIKSLPRPGATEYWDDRAKASYSYDPVKRILHSYETVWSLEWKIDYAKRKGLAGFICWDASGDSNLLKRLGTT